MFGKLKNYFCNWFTFGNQTQGLKRERDSSLDEQVGDSVASTNNVPSNKKLKLMSGKSQDSIQGMAQEQLSKRDLETRDKNWSQFLKPTLLQTSTPIGSPIQSDAPHLKDHRSSLIGHNDNSSVRKMELHHHLPSIDNGSTLVDAGSSLSQLEKLMVERLGSSATGTKPTACLFQITDAPVLSYPQLTENFCGQVKKNEFQPSSHSMKSPTKPTVQTWKKHMLNGGIYKTSYKPMIQKLYGSPKQQKLRAMKLSLLNSHPENLTTQNCVRMEEKLCYRALLSQFVSKSPLSKLSPSSPISNSRNSSGILVEKIDNKEAQSIQTQLKKSSVVIDLDNDSSISDKTTTASPTPSSAKPLIRINTLEDALARSPQYDCRFISDIKSRYSAKEREYQRLRAEEAIRSKVLAENREGWENELEQRLRKQLEIVTRPVIDERVEEIVSLPEITDEMHMVIDKALNGHSDGEVLCDAFNLTITRRDLKTLASLNWLNDQVINFYLTLIMERSNSGDWPKAFAFNTFFYPKLMSSGHAGLKRWTRKVDLFQQDFILIPVHLGLHWCLATVCPKDQAIRYYDSMGGRNMECLNALKRYMEAESLDKKKTPLDTSSWKLECVENIPQQMNGSDCGMFACKYAEYLSRKAKITFDQKDMPYFRRRMVYEIITQKLSHP